MALITQNFGFDDPILFIVRFNSATEEILSVEPN